MANAAHIVELVDELVLGLLEPDQAAAARAHAERCEGCAAALGEAEEAYQLTALELPGATPSAALRGRLLASAQSQNRFARFVDRVAELIQVSRDRAAGLLQAIDDPASWETAPWAGVRLFHLPAGPALSNAVVGFVRMPGGTPFPEHRHLGDEITLVLQGSARDSRGGAISRTGDETSNAAETGHHFVALPGPDYIYLVVVDQGVDFGNGDIIRAGDPRM